MEDVDHGDGLRRGTPRDTIEASFLLGTELACSFGDVQADRRRCATKLVCKEAETARHCVRQTGEGRYERYRHRIDVELVLVELHACEATAGSISSENHRGRECDQRTHALARVPHPEGSRSHSRSHSRRSASRGLRLGWTRHAEGAARRGLACGWLIRASTEFKRAGSGCLVTVATMRRSRPAPVPPSLARPNGHRFLPRARTFRACGFIP